MEGSGGGTPTTGLDLSAKYQKLAAEYAKMRAQVSVLKKGVIDEQTKTTLLKDEAQDKDQKMRKLEQEMDSLTFRNAQMEKRIGFLQDELQEATAKSKAKGKSRGQVQVETESSYSQPALDYELLSKIEENIQLHKQISEMEEAHRKETFEIKRELEQKIKGPAINPMQQEHIDCLEAEKLSLTYSLQNSLDEVEAYKDQVAQLQAKIREQGIEAELRAEIGSRSRCQDTTVNFTSDNQVNEMRPPSESSTLMDTTSLVDKLTAAEQQREHWMLEYQLLKMKYSKIFMKWEEAKGILKSIGKDDLMSGEITPCTETVQSFTTMVGKIEVISDDPQSWGRSYEKEVKDYLRNRINELIGLLQLADSKAITFHDECVSLQKLLCISVQRRQDLEQVLANVEQKMQQVQEEFEATKGNYETQLSTMSDHIANMNEKLTLQKDTIDDLTYQLSVKVAKPKK